MSTSLALAVNDLKVLYTELHPVKTKWYDIGLILDVPVEALETIRTQNRDDLGACLREMLLCALKSTAVELTWKGITDALRNVVIGEEYLADTLSNKYCSEGEGDRKITSFAEKLTDVLVHIAQWKDLPGKAGAQDTAINNFISRSVECGNSLDDIKQQLKKVNLEKLLISKEVFTKALQFADEEYAKSKPTKASEILHVHESDSATKDTQVESLFCKDTVYHASLCCHAVSTYNAGNYQKFFKNRELVPGHSFNAVSFSRSKEENFLIAQKGESTVYFAFQGKLSLSDWARDYTSFNEGILVQSEKFPIRYIIELLNKQCRIVLTGFSFGGLLASTVAACVWDSPYISSDLLKENMACITFGQPHVTVNILERVARRRPKMISSIHAIFIKDDQIPRLMGLLDECWSDNIQQSQSESTVGVQLSAVVNHGQAMPFNDQITSVLLDLFSKLQSNFQSLAPIKVVEELKVKLGELISDVQTLREFTPVFTHYTTSHEECTSGLVITQDTLSVAVSHIQSLTAALYNQHSMLEYSKDIFECYLDKQPKYPFPVSKQHALGDLNNLRPSIEGIQIHHHGNQCAVVVEGSNLWFCYQISFRGQKLPIPASEISGSAIQLINMSGQRESLSSGRERVTLFNYFKSKSNYQDVEVHEKKYSTTTRQEQLAKLTPSQVIELGYLSALLEHYQVETNSSFSYKFDVIRRFLEEVVKVVPFESIVYAITSGNYQTAMQCASALKTCNTKIPRTALMYAGLFDAEVHLRHGTPAHVLQTMEFKAKEEVKYLSRAHRSVYMESEEFVYRYGIYQPISMQDSPQFSAPIPLGEVRINLKDAGIKPSTINVQVADDLLQLQENYFKKEKFGLKLHGPSLELVSMSNIEDLYPVHGESSVLKSPLNILATSRRELAKLSEKSSEMCSNKRMLQIVNAIRCNELDTCTSLLGGFMHQGVVDIVLSPRDKQEDSGLFLTAAASVGVWALFSLDYSHVQPILAKCQGEQLLVKLFDYVKGITGIHHESDKNEVNPYAAKLQFIVQGMTKTVTCNTQHVSYSLERQLDELCRERNINAETPLSTITGKWSTLFKGYTLSLVHHCSRFLIARWLKWALMIHNLREELAKYTAVGVVGLVNSGKSKLVNTLFGIDIPTGTTEGKRTTVPFLYNLDESVEGLNVVDFPGVDDEDDSIGELADLLLTIAQIIIFVVDYRKAHTQSAKKWLERLQKENVPFLVCLTFGDKLYAEHMSPKGVDPSKNSMTKTIKEQLSEIKGKLHCVGSHQIQFFSFCQDNDSVLNSDPGRKKLKEVGIGTPLQVGEWLVKVFRKDFDQDELANQLEPFMHRNVALCSL